MDIARKVISWFRGLSFWFCIGRLNSEKTRFSGPRQTQGNRQLLRRYAYEDQNWASGRTPRSEDVLDEAVFLQCEKGKLYGWTALFLINDQYRSMMNVEHSMMDDE